MPTYTVVATIVDGEHVNDRPVDNRVLCVTTKYGEALNAARAHRVTRYRHRETGEVRDLTENDTVGCAFAADDTLFLWIGKAVREVVVSYAEIHEDAGPSNEALAPSERR